MIFGVKLFIFNDKRLFDHKIFKILPDNINVIPFGKICSECIPFDPPYYLDDWTTGRVSNRFNKTGVFT